MNNRWSLNVVISVCAGVLAAALTGCSSNTSSVPVAEAPAPQVTETTTAPAKPAARSAETQMAPTGTTSKAAAKGIAWQPNFKAAWTQAYTAKKPIMIDFYADWCQPCKMMDNETFPDTSVTQAASQFTNVKVDVDKETDLVKKYKITGLPTTMWLNNKGEIIHKIEGFYPPADFLKEMKFAQSKFTPLS